MVTDSEPSPPSPAVVQLLAAVLAETSEGDFSRVLQVASDSIASHTRADAVSLLCTSGSLALSRTGTWPEPTQVRLDAWERALTACVRQNRQTLTEESPPPTVVEVSRWVVYNAPLLSGSHVVGSLSVCVPGERHSEAAAAVQEASVWLGPLLALVQDLEVENRRLGALGMVFHAGGAAIGSEDWQTRLQNTLRLACRMVNASGCVILTASEEGEQFRCELAYLPGESVDWTGATLKAAGILGHAYRANETIVANEPAHDSRYAPEVEGALTDALQSLLAVPLQSRGVSFGALAAINRRDPLGFSAHDAWLLESVAAHVALILENARLCCSVQEDRRWIADLQRFMRTDIANNLHQGAIQMLAAIAMEVDHLVQLAVVKPDAMAEELEEMKGLMREATREARLLLFELRPTVLATDGLVATLDAYIQQLPGQGTGVHFTHPDTLPEMNPLVVQVAFFSAAVGLRHAQHHGQAENVWLEIGTQDGHLRIAIEDDGKPHSQRRCARQEQDQTCIAYIEGQARLVNGSVEVRDGPPRDKPRIQIELPLCGP